MQLDEKRNPIKDYLKATDWYIVVLSLLCAIYGIVLINSATLSMGSSKYVLVQAAALCIGILGFVAASLIDLDHISVLWIWLYAANICLAASLFFFGVDGGTGNKSWIRFGPVGIQPAEIGKIIMIFTLAQHIRLLEGRVSKFLSVVQLAAHVLIISGTVYLFSHDLGMVLAYLFVGMVMIFAAGVKLHWFALVGFAGFAAVPLIWNHFTQKQRDRILVIFDPTINETISWQAEQSKIALGSGGMTGQGYMQGRQTQFSQLPAKHTDFIFAVAGEEFGFIGCTVIIILLTLLILRIFYVSFKADDTFSSLVCVGIGATFLFQTVVNIGMCIGMTPVIGLTLPLFSYGGSSIVALMTSLGLVSGVRMRLKPSWLK